MGNIVEETKPAASRPASKEALDEKPLNRKPYGTARPAPPPKENGD